MGNKCGEICTDPSSDHKMEDNPSVVDRNKKEFLNKFVKGLKKVDQFPSDKIPDHAFQTINKVGKHSSDMTDIYQISYPFHGYFLKQAAQPKEGESHPIEINFNGVVKLYKFDESQNFAGYYQGNIQDLSANDSQGIYVYPNGDHYYGQVENNAANGTGVFRSFDGAYSYEGKWHDDYPSGDGTEKTPKSEYEGIFEKGKKDGRGKLSLQNKQIVYEGEFKNNQITGEGTLYVANSKSTFAGKFENGQLNGHGTWKNSSQSYEGNFVDGKKDGYGKLLFSDGTIYEGEFKNDLPNGKGELRKGKNPPVQGQWHNGRFATAQISQIHLEDPHKH